MPKAEQLTLDYEAKKESEAEKDIRILEATIKENLKGRNKKEKLSVHFFHSAAAQYFIDADKMGFRQSLTEAMREEMDLEIWQEILKIIKESGFSCTAGVENEINNSRQRIEKRQRKAGYVVSGAEKSLPRGDN